ncbi:MAG TPA: hypothetical protein VM099_02370 [Gemmatimonadaceae bacterium]|nr:hypothetical protein [Gemmatimonadaceae bacterium]
MTNARARQLAAICFAAGAGIGLVFWSRVQRQYRRDLFSKHPLRRLAALSYLRGRPTVNTARLLREYVAWEHSPILRQRGVRLMRRLEQTLP